MTKITKLIWRLKEQPTTESLRELVKDKILTNEEAREILFSSEDIEDRDKKSLESEIKFLRELVEKLAGKNNSRIIETIREIQPIYRTYTWSQPYTIWCDTAGTGGTFTATSTGNFSNIVTF